MQSYEHTDYSRSKAMWTQENDVNSTRNPHSCTAVFNW